MMQTNHYNRIDTLIKRSPLVIAGIYLVFSSIWIVYSDSWVLSYYTDPQTITTIQTYKGWAFVSLSAVVAVDTLPTLKTYRSPLIQVFQNLIENSLKYTREGVKPKILIQAEEKEEEWIFSVKDNGKGIDPEYFDKIFIIFQRLDSEDRFGGTGLGLSVVKKIVDNLDGRIWVGSEVDKGSTFYFSIPK